MSIKEQIINVDNNLQVIELLSDRLSSDDIIELNNYINNYKGKTINLHFTKNININLFKKINIRTNLTNLIIKTPDGDFKWLSH